MLEINGVQVFRKDYYREEMWYQFEREKAFLSALHPYHGFPKILRTGQMPYQDVEGAPIVNYMDLTYCGGLIENAGVAYDIVELQLASLITVLEHVGIKHRDITPGNLVWHPTLGLHLVDFGCAIWYGEPDEVPDYIWTSRWEMTKLTDREHAFITMHELKTGHAIQEEEWISGGYRECYQIKSK